MQSIYYAIRTILFTLILYWGPTLSAQKMVEKLTDLFEFPISNVTDSTRYQNKMVLAPVLLYTPATSLGLGLGVNFLFKPKNAGGETRTSSIPASVIYTFRNQVVAYSGYTVFFPQEKYILKGNTEYSKFPLSYYGVGSQSTEADIQDITYSRFLLEPLLLRKVTGAFFVGGGFRYNTYRNVQPQENPDGNPAVPLSSELASTSVGLRTAMAIDNRNNILNATNGYLAELTHEFYGDVLGGTNQYMVTNFDLRRYYQPWSERDDVLAFQLFARLAWGDAPPLDQPALGGAVLLRGFHTGRFRDQYAFFGQAEYRLQLLDRLGIVLFGGAGEVASSTSGMRLDKIKYSLGTGLRLKIVPSENLNVRFDYAFGLGAISDQNFYLGIAESF